MRGRCGFPDKEKPPARCAGGPKEQVFRIFGSLHLEAVAEIARRRNRLPLEQVVDEVVLGELPILIHIHDHAVVAQSHRRIVGSPPDGLLAGTVRAGVLDRHGHLVGTRSD